MTPVPLIAEAALPAVETVGRIVTVGRVIELETSIPAAGAAKVIRTGADAVAAMDACTPQLIEAAAARAITIARFAAIMSDAPSL